MAMILVTEALLLSIPKLADVNIIILDPVEAGVTVLLKTLVQLVPEHVCLESLAVCKACNVLPEPNVLVSVGVAQDKTPEPSVFKYWFADPSSTGRVS